MTDKLQVYVGGAYAGDLERSDTGYRFNYQSDYSGPPVFLNLPLRSGEKLWKEFPPHFDGLLPEGVLLDQLLVAGKLDRSDKWGQLKAVGRDLTGFLSVFPDGEAVETSASWVVAEGRKARVKIQPGRDALPHDWSELVTFHSREAPRMSLSGVQPKVSAVFWIERFDRQGPTNRTRLRVEDTCQLLEVPSSWKYLGNLETLVQVIRQFTSNPTLQLARFFDRILFNWVIGNGDMHLKNWSLIENGPLIELAPAYDFLNTAILIDREEESALSLADRHQSFDRALLLDIFGRELCGLQPARIERMLRRLQQIDWADPISKSALSEQSKAAYLAVVEARMKRLMRV